MIDPVKMNLAVEIAGVKFKNPVMTASGTFGSGMEYSEYIDLNRLGGIIVKGVSDKPWKGNPPPRIAETYGGMLNSIGLQNPGVEVFIERDIPFLRKYDTKIVVNVCGHTQDEYINVVSALKNVDIDMLELNISCPNLCEGGITFGTDRAVAEKLVSAVKKHAGQPLMVKLSPNVTNIVEIAKAVEYAGADGISLINTLMGMKIDVHKREAVLKNKIGGLSGPAIKPVAVRMVYQVAKSVNIPIIGMGGIMNGEDALEFIMAGATAIAVGTANFNNPAASSCVLDEIVNYMTLYDIYDINKLRGIV